MATKLWGQRRASIKVSFGGARVSSSRNRAFG